MSNKKIIIPSRRRGITATLTAQDKLDISDNIETAIGSQVAILQVSDAGAGHSFRLLNPSKRLRSSEVKTISGTSGDELDMTTSHVVIAKKIVEVTSTGIAISARFFARNSTGNLHTLDVYFRRTGSITGGAVTSPIVANSTGYLDSRYIVHNGGLTEGDIIEVEVLARSQQGAGLFVTADYEITPLHSFNAIRVLEIGDSYVENGRNGSNRSALGSGPSVENYTNGDVITPVSLNKGVSSERIDEISARLPSAIALAPDAITISAGVNDLLQNTSDTGEQLADALIAMGRTVANSGIPHILRTVVAMDDFTDAQEARRMALNATLRLRCPYVFSDPAAIADGLSKGTPKLMGLSYDGKHPNANMAKIFGIADAIAFRDLGIGNAQRGLNYIDAPLTGSSGTLSSGATGTLVDGWSLSANSGVMVSGNRISGFKALETDIILTSPVYDFDTGLSAGHEGAAEFDITWQGGADIQQLIFKTRFIAADGGTSTGETSTGSANGIETIPPNLGARCVDAINGFYSSGAVTIPASTTKVQLSVTILGAGPIDLTIHDIAMRKTS